MAARIHELRAERQALVKKANAALRAANEKAKTEKRRLSAEELAEADAFDVQLAAIDEEVHIEERMHDRERGSVAVVEDAPPAGGPGAMTADRMQREMGLTSRQAERATTVFERDSGRLGQPGNGRQGGIRSMGEFLQVVRHAARGAAFVDPRLMGVRDNVPDDLGQLQQMPGGRGYFAGPAGADESVDSEGGFLVQTDWG
ncbi:MAG TPA: hypothetical protein VGS00_05810, partial [Thermoanaerobaculia bacterium]|nr:hypothetical protein [Thermoanaerobaculia bacterium]